MSQDTPTQPPAPKASSQNHGNRFEDTAKAGVFPGSANGGRSPCQAHDVEAEFNRNNMDVSIKTCREHGTVCLADARRMWEDVPTYEMLVAEWRQCHDPQSDPPDFKEVVRVHQFAITPEFQDALRGGVSKQEVAAIHDGIKAFGEGEHVRARDAVRNSLVALGKAHEAHPAAMQLNPKIDSHRQRRLQCSIPLSRMVDIAEALAKSAAPRPGLQRHTATKDRVEPVAGFHAIYESSIGSISLPNRIVGSGPRRFSKKAKSRTAKASP